MILPRTSSRFASLIAQSSSINRVPIRLAATVASEEVQAPKGPWQKLASLSLPPQMSDENVKGYANALFSALGGPTPYKATERMLWLFGGLAYCYGGHYFFLNEDLIEVLGLLVAGTVFYQNAKAPFLEMCAANAASMQQNYGLRIKTALNSLVTRKDELQAYKDINEVNKAIVMMIRENVQNRVKVHMLKQRNDLLAGAKGQLDTKARQNLERRDRERRELLAIVNARVLERVKSQEFQEKYLRQCLVDLGELASKRKATVK